MQLRQYQLEAVRAAQQHVRTHPSADAPLIVVPTGGGKTPIIATLCRDAVANGQRVLVLAHVKELLEQSAHTLTRLAPDVPVGIFSAGLGRKQLHAPVTVASIQSIQRQAHRLGRVDLVLIDEAHLLPPKGDGMYRRFLASARDINPALRLIGLTATPFRMKSGPLCGPNEMFRSICFEIGVRELIEQRFLSPLVTTTSARSVDTSNLRVVRGEFAQRDVEQLVDTEAIVRAACAEVVDATRDRQGTLLFAASIAHAQHIQTALREHHGVVCGLVSSQTPGIERDRTIAAFRRRELKYLANVSVLTTGFDAPHVDCVALLRPTMSAGLYYQMCGRGLRVASGKRDCLVLDFAGNIGRHGPIDGLWKDPPKPRRAGGVTKPCPSCGELIAGGYRICPHCGYEFPPPTPLLRAIPDEGLIVSSIDGPLLPHQYEVSDVWYGVHVKSVPTGVVGLRPRRSMRVTYRTRDGRTFSEWVCCEHPQGWYPRLCAERWWAMRGPAGQAMPANVDALVAMGQSGQLREPVRITVRWEPGSRFCRIVAPVFVRRSQAELAGEVR
jgi:DNA repair protein RadD